MNAQESGRFLDAITDANPTATLKELPLDKALKGGLAEHLQPDTLLCIDGGDGTMNSVVQTLLEDGAFSELQRKVPVLPIWGGNANDIAHILNGEPSAQKFQEIFTKGKVLPIHPLRCTIEADGKQTVRLAVCYASFGATANAARHANKSSFRKNPLLALPGGKAISEVALVIKALRDAPTFVVEHEGERKVVYDWLIGKGPRMAKIGRLPVGLADKVFYQSMIEHKSLQKVVNRAASMARGRLTPTNNKKPITFTTTESIWAQFDGEPLHTPPHATITIGLNPTPFYTLSTNPQL